MTRAPLITPTARIGQLVLDNVSNQHAQWAKHTTRRWRNHAHKITIDMVDVMGWGDKDMSAQSRLRVNITVVGEVFELSDIESSAFCRDFLRRFNQPEESFDTLIIKHLQDSNKAQ